MIEQGVSASRYHDCCRFIPRMLPLLSLPMCREYAIEATMDTAAIHACEGAQKKKKTKKKKRMGTQLASHPCKEADLLRIYKGSHIPPSALSYGVPLRSIPLGIYLNAMYTSFGTSSPISPLAILALLRVLPPDLLHRPLQSTLHGSFAES